MLRGRPPCLRCVGRAARPGTIGVEVRSKTLDPRPAGRATCALLGRENTPLTFVNRCDYWSAQRGADNSNFGPSFGERTIVWSGREISGARVELAKVASPSGKTAAPERST
jgi:hypothetical protein